MQDNDTYNGLEYSQEQIELGHQGKRKNIRRSPERSGSH